MAFIGQYAMQILQFLHFSVITALPLAMIASCLQNATHWLQPTQLLFTYILISAQKYPSLPFLKNLLQQGCLTLCLIEKDDLEPYLFSLYINVSVLT